MTYKTDNQKPGTRINKYVAQSGVCSRREADELIKKRKVFINNSPATLGSVVNTHDTVRVDHKTISPKQKKVYILLNKPKGIVCTTDLREKKNIIDFVGFNERIFPVGRLDQMSEGIIILTNDGDIVNKILRASHGHEKVYEVSVDKEVTDDFLYKMHKGVPILGQVTKECRVSKKGKNGFRITLTQGLNRQIRRMCKYLNYNVRTLKRTRIVNLDSKGLSVGEWRFIKRGELIQMEKDLQVNINTSVNKGR